ncbi:MAG: hemerythrin domain-containing protein [Bacteroidales bacterium]|nr:hemerythrin domain-containing protein [Bacteroidales bacterium]
MTVTDTNPNMKLSELVGRNFQVIGLLERLGVRGNFGDKTVADVCSSQDMDPGTFMMLYDFYVDERFKPTEKMLREGSIRDVAEYLHRSHEYYLDTALGSLSDLLYRLLAPCNETQKKVFRRFYQDYEEELNRHFDFEEKHVMPYIRALTEGGDAGDSAIESFTDDHNSINEKISDLKNLVMNSLPEGCDPALRMQTLYMICSLEYDLGRHTAVEEEILEPMAQMLENSGSQSRRRSSEDEREALSDREKEILVGVAKGLLNKEIADMYNISPYTVITHRKNITRKTGIKSVAGLTVYALLNGLIDFNDVD